jgi:hypothetical protein
MKWKDGNSIYELALRFGYSGCEAFIYIHYTGLGKCETHSLIVIGKFLFVSLLV